MEKAKKQNNQKGVLIALVIGVVILLVIISSIYIITNKTKKPVDKVEENNDKVVEEVREYNYNEKVIEDKEVNGIKFTEVNCYWDGVNSNISYKVTNTTDKPVKIGEYTIEAYDSSDTLFYILSPYMDKELAPGESYQDMISVSENLGNAKEIKIFIDSEE